MEQLPLVVYIDAVDAISSSIYASPQIEGLLGYSPAEWRDDPLLFVRLLHRDDRERVLAAHAHTHATGEPLSLEYRLLARDGREIWVHDEGYVLTDASHGQVLQGYLLDVTERRRAEQALRHQALHDPLTGLANRTLFGDRLQHAIDRLVDDEAAVAVIALDIDDFTAVNDSLGHQLQEAGFVDDVRRALTDSGLGADALTLEITESVIAQQRESLSSTLESLRALGVRLALDDFGTGYSSLSQLRSPPVAELKIDRSFVRGLHTDADNAALVRAKLDLGRALGLTTVAEGVESDAEAEELRLLGCDLGQGFHFARPLPADAFERHLARSGTQRPAA